MGIRGGPEGRSRLYGRVRVGITVAKCPKAALKRAQSRRWRESGATPPFGCGWTAASRGSCESGVAAPLCHRTPGRFRTPGICPNARFVRICSLMFTFWGKRGRWWEGTNPERQAADSDIVQITGLETILQGYLRGFTRLYEGLQAYTSVYKAI